MRFWVVAGSGLATLILLVVGAMSVPAALIGQHESQFWMREPILFGLMLSCAVAVPAFLAACTWADKEDE